MQDHDLLELAAKAAGIGLVWSSDQESPRDAGCWNIWNPLTDDGDALRLAVKLHIHIRLYDGQTSAEPALRSRKFHGVESHIIGSYAATRLAIVRAAAEIGKSI